MKHVIDRDEFTEAARTLQKINPHADRSLESLVDSMIWNAEDLESGYCSTLGYVLSVFTYRGKFKPDGSPLTGVYVSFNAWTVAQYVNGRR